MQHAYESAPDAIFQIVVEIVPLTIFVHHSSLLHRSPSRNGTPIGLENI